METLKIIKDKLFDIAKSFNTDSENYEIVAVSNCLVSINSKEYHNDITYYEFVHRNFEDLIELGFDIVELSKIAMNTLSATKLLFGNKRELPLLFECRNFGISDYQKHSATKLVKCGGFSLNEETFNYEYGNIYLIDCVEFEIDKEIYQKVKYNGNQIYIINNGVEATINSRYFD